MPPAPIADTISYGPSRVPEVSGMGSGPTFFAPAVGPHPHGAHSRRLDPARRGRRRSCRLLQSQTRFHTDRAARPRSAACGVSLLADLRRGRYGVCARRGAGELDLADDIAVDIEHDELAGRYSHRARAVV